MDTPYTLRHFKLAVAAFFAALVTGAVAFGLALHEGALDAVYRSTVTVSLTGIDTKPRPPPARWSRSCSSSRGWQSTVTLRARSSS